MECLSEVLVKNIYKKKINYFVITEKVHILLQNKNLNDLLNLEIRIYKY